MSSDEPKDETFRKEGGEEKSEEEPVSEEMFVLSDSGDTGKQEVSDKVVAAKLNEYGLDFLSCGNFNEAMEAFDKAIELDPDNIDLLNNKAQALETVGKYDEALEFYEKAIKINSEDPDIWNNMAFSLSQVGKYDEAVKAYEKALELRPDYPNA